MSLSGPDWVKLNRLLDQALDLPPEERSQWMESLPQEYASLRTTLADLLLQRAVVDTADVLPRAPGFPLDSIDPVREGESIGPYRLLREIGSGGMATVWLAERADGSMQRQVALKLPRIQALDRDLPQRLARERDILASLEHPGIARLYDAGVHRGTRPYLALEFVDGLPLDRYVAERALSIRERLQLFEQVARAVGFAHSRLIVHRDLKPTNVLVRPSGEVLLLDFGIAGLLEPDADHSLAHRALTPRYAAPEQFAGEPATVATDIYSLGVMLYEVLAERSPYVSRGNIVCLAPPPLSESMRSTGSKRIARDLEWIVKRAMELDPENRYATVSDLLADLTRYRRHQPIAARPASHWYRMWMFAGRYRVAVSLTSALMIAIVSGAFVSARQARIAVRERDRAVQMLEQSTATNEFWNKVLSESVANDETITMQELLRRSEQLAERAASSSPLQYAVAVDSIASLYLSYGLPGKAETLLARTLEQYQGLDEGKHVMCYLRCEYALAIGSLGRTREAEEIFEQVLAGLANEPGVRQYCLRSRAAIASENFEAARALTFIKQAQALHAQSPVRSPWESAQILAERAFAHVLSGETELAQRYYSEAWSLFEQLDRAESHAALSMLNNWGILAMSTGQPAVALERYDRAVAISRKRSPDGQPPPDLIGNRAAALLALARYAESATEFDRMRVRAEADGNLRFVAFAAAGSADANLRRGEQALAQIRLDGFPRDERRKLSRASPPLLRVAVVEARLLSEQGDDNAARRLLDDAIVEFDRRATAIRPHVLALVARSELLLKTSFPQQALEDAQHAKEVARITRGQNAYSDLVGIAALAQARAELAMGRHAIAGRLLEEARDNLRQTVGASHPDVVITLQMTAALQPMT